MTAEAILKAIEAKLRNDAQLKRANKDERREWLVGLTPEARAKAEYAEELLFYLLSAKQD